MAQNSMEWYNGTSSNSSTDLPPQGTTAHIHISELLSKEVAVILSIICALASVIGTFGNSLVLLAVRRSANLRTVPDLFITSLAFSDFSVCALYLPMQIYDFNYKPQEDNNLYIVFNLAKGFLGHSSMVASASSMFAVTIDRLYAIRFPFKYLAVVTSEKALAGIAVVWLISFAFATVYAGPAIIPRSYLRFYNAGLLSTTVIVYIYIFITAKRQENRIQKMHKGSKGTITEKKVTKTTFTVVGAYVLFWMPMFLLPAIYNPSRNLIQFRKGFSWVQTSLACNSAINPFIYFMRNSKYRRAFTKILGIERHNADK